MESYGIQCSSSSFYCGHFFQKIVEKFGDELKEEKHLSAFKKIQLNQYYFHLEIKNLNPLSSYLPL